MSFPRSTRLLAAAAALLAAAACASTQIVPGHGVEDLKAIHNESDWTPRSPANLTSSPTSYELGRRLEGVQVGGNPNWYQITDHRALELEILDKLSETDPLDLNMAVEVTAVMVIELLHDDYAEARIRAAAILSKFAGAWVERAGVRLRDVDPNVDLAQAIRDYTAAVQAVEAPEYKDKVAAALDTIDRAAIGDPVTAARLLVGVSRSLQESPLMITGQNTLQSTGVRTILMALKEGMKDADPQVADQCRARYELIMRYAAE